jgi:hypothetical protein
LIELLLKPWVFSKKQSSCLLCENVIRIQMFG